MSKDNPSEEFVYHGSTALVKKLMPRPHPLLPGMSVVFATPYRAFALAFISKTWKDEDIDLGLVNGAPVLRELKPNAFDHLKVKGYLYTFKKRGFTHKPGLAKFEAVSHSVASPHGIELFKNAFAEIEAQGIQLIRYG